MPERIQRKRTKGWRLPPNTVVVSRPSKWGNPYSLKDVAEMYAEYPPAERRAVAQMLFRRDGEHWGMLAVWLDDRPDRVAEMFWETVDRGATRNYQEYAASELRGKDLACWCPLVDADGNPVPCHADVLLEWANA